MEFIGPIIGSAIIPFAIRRHVKDLVIGACCQLQDAGICFVKIRSSRSFQRFIQETLFARQSTKKYRRKNDQFKEDIIFRHISSGLLLLECRVESKCESPVPGWPNYIHIEEFNLRV